MKSSYYAGVVLLCVVSLVGCKGKDKVKWQTCPGWDESFTVRMPGDPGDMIDSVPAGRGSVIKLRNLELITQYVHYTAGYAEYPSGFLKSMGRNSKEIFDKAQQAIVQSRNAKVIEQKDLKDKRYPMRSFTISFYVAESSSDAILRQDLYLVKGRMYIVQSLAFPGKIEQCQDVINEYHDSFVIKKDR